MFSYTGELSITFSPGLINVRMISTMPTPTSVAILICLVSTCQPQRFAAKFAKASNNSGNGPKYPVSDLSTISVNAAFIFGAVGKSISATGSGNTSEGKCRHLTLFRLRNSASVNARTASAIAASMPLPVIN